MRFTHEAWVVAGFERPLTARARLYMRHNAEEWQQQDSIQKERPIAKPC